MKKIFKIVASVLLVLLVLQLVIFLTARYSWKLFGFAMCESPDVLYIETVYVTDKTVHISGNTSSSATSYIGYTYKIKDDVLYLGIKQNLLFGFDNRNGRYSFVIEDDFENIESVYLTNKQEEKCIWTEENDKKYMEKIQKCRLYENISVSYNSSDAANGVVTVVNRNVLSEQIKEQIKNAEFVYADAELLKRIQHPTFSDELYLSKGGRYLGVAELENGEEMYLSFERHYNYYDIIGKTGHYDY